jgi:hypothetical protein
LRAALLLRVVEARLVENVRQERIVDLHEKTGVDDRPVLLAHLRGECVEILLVRFVVLVAPGPRWRGRWQKHLLVGDTGRRGGGFDIGDVGLHQPFAAVFDRADAKNRRKRNNRSAGIARLKYCS